MSRQAISVLSLTCSGHEHTLSVVEVPLIALCRLLGISLHSTDMPSRSTCFCFHHASATLTQHVSAGWQARRALLLRPRSASLATSWAACGRDTSEPSDPGHLQSS